MAMGKCIYCGERVHVRDSRFLPESEYVRRRYVCPSGHRFTTVEQVVLAKRSHSRGTEFDRRSQDERVRAALANAVAQLKDAMPPKPLPPKQKMMPTVSSKLRGAALANLKKANKARADQKKASKTRSALAA